MSGLGRFRLPLSLIATASVVAAAALTLTANSQTLADLTRIGVWVANDADGSVSHIGPGGADALLGLDQPTGDIQVLEMDGAAYVIDEDGRISRIDPTSLEVSDGSVLPVADAEVVVGGGHVYAVDREQGSVSELDPITLSNMSPPLELSTSLSSVVVDLSGQLWALSSDNGELVRVSGASIVSSWRVVAPGAVAEVSVVEDSVIVIDAGEASLQVVAGPESGKEFELPAAGGTLRAPRVVEHGPMIPMLNEDDELTVVDIRSGDTMTVPLGAPGRDLGTPVIAARRVYVPDNAGGELLVAEVRAGEARFVDTVGLAGGGRHLELVVKGDFTYVNDPGSENAWVITPDGTLTPIDKYRSRPGRETADPATPDRPEPPPTTTPLPPSAPSTTLPPATIVVPPGAEGGPPAANPSPTTSSTVPFSTSTTSSTVPGAGSTTVPDGDGAVLNVVATAANESASVEWSPPTDWYPVTGYTVTIQPSGPTDHLGPSNTSHEVDGLMNGTTYWFEIEAESDEGRGTPVRSNDVVPAEIVPDPPENLEVSAVNATVEATWDPPPGPDGVVVDGYQVFVRDVDAQEPAARLDVDKDTTSVDVTPLVNGTDYRVRVRAVTPGGATGELAISDVVMPQGPPLRPASVTASQTGDGTTTVEWTMPSNGSQGSPITQFDVSWEITSLVAGTDTIEVDGDETSTEIPGLENGQTYRFSVFARNDIGAGPARSAPDVTIQSMRPDPPGNVQATAGDRQVTLTWQEPSGNGTTIDGYQVHNITLGQIRPATSTSYTWPGLINGTGYRFEVRARGGNGSTGPWAAATPSPITPKGPPLAPPNVRGHGGDRECTITWDGADPNGTTITEYRIRNVNRREVFHVRDPGARSYTWEGLTPAARYTFHVWAVGDGMEGDLTADESCVTDPAPTTTTTTTTTSSTTTTTIWEPPCPDAQGVTAAAIPDCDDDPPLQAQSVFGLATALAFTGWLLWSRRRRRLR